MALELIKDLQSVIFDTFSAYPQWVSAILVALIGACVGSFINVVTYRAPLILKANEEDYVSKNYGLKIPSARFENTKRSHCPNCKEKIPVFLNIPILGWLSLMGKSKCCNQKISSKYILVEISTTIIALLTFTTHGSIDLVLILALISIFSAITISLIDFSHKLIFDKHAVIYVTSTLLYLNLSNEKSDFVFIGLLLTLGLYVSVISYQNIRNKLLKTDIQMMGDGDWSLWFVMFCAISSLEPEISGLINRTAESVLIVAALGFTTLITGIALGKLSKQSVTLSQEFPAAPSILITTIGLLLTTL